uniref:Uncharacterized protein n=1 Tax=Ciona savignyi TaxID=51511 RepID=H2YVL9_CIOSA
MTCVFNRPLAVTKNVSGTMTTWDLSTNSFHLLYAHGSVESNGDYDYHFRNRSASPSQFNFNDPTSTSTVYELTTTPRSASSRDVISIFCIVTSVIFSMTL